MQKSYQSLADDLGISYQVLSSKCNIERGTYLCWICREILCTQWHMLRDTQKTYLFEIMRIILNPGNRQSSVLNSLVENKLLVFNDSYLNQLANILGARSPFVVADAESETLYD